MTLADRVVILEEGRVTQAGHVRRRSTQTSRSRYAAELAGVNLFAGRPEPLDGWGRAAGGMAEGDVVVGWPDDLPPGLRSMASSGRFDPSDVVVHSGGSRHDLRSKRLAWRGRGPRDLRGASQRLRIASQPPLVAEVTAGSVNQLGLVRGMEVWASFKAVEVEITLPALPGSDDKYPG